MLARLQVSQFIEVIMEFDTILCTTNLANSDVKYLILLTLVLHVHQNNTIAMSRTGFKANDI